jgi:TolB-like protein/class 3 adenylate cyclase
MIHSAHAVGSTALATGRVERRLAAILAADVAGYSRLMGVDEEGTLARLKALRRELADPKIKEHRGRIVKTTGDGLLIEFASVVDAVRCAVEVQREMAERNADVSPDGRIEFRMGINLGDIIKDGRDIYGDGVNVAARLEALAEPGGICVSRVVRDQVRDKLAFSFEDMGEQQVKNITRPIRVHRILLGEQSNRSETITGGPQQNPPLALPNKPSIAVLPFQNMSGDSEQEYFADGMVEEIITALSRIRWLFVIARNSSFTYKGQSVDVKQVGRELGVRYVLEGSVRKAGQRVRITGQLIDAVSGNHIWADRFDGSLEDIFELQDRVAVSVAGVIEPTLQAAEIRRSSERPTSDLTAYDLYLRALALLRAGEKEQYLKCLDTLQQAIERDPLYGPALALAAFVHQVLHVSGWTNDASATRTRRSSTCAAGASGRCPGQPELGISHFETSLRLSPHARRSPIFMSIGVGHFFARRFDDGATMLLRSLQEHPGFAPTYRFLAACYAHMGRLDDARKIVQRLRAITPLIVPKNATHWRNPDLRELYLSGLRLAAGETA